MSETTHKSLATTVSPPGTRGELVVISASPPPTLEERAVQIRKAHIDVAAAILTAVERALDAGLQLSAAKEDVRHGGFEDYVARCGLKMRTAQNYMRLVRHEAKVREQVAEKANGNAYLTMPAALKYVAGLEAKKKPKRRTAPKASKFRSLFGGR